MNGGLALLSLLLANVADAVLDGTLGFHVSCTDIGSPYNFFSQDCHGASPIIVPGACDETSEAAKVTHPVSRETAAGVKNPCDLSDFDFEENVDCIGEFQRCGIDCGKTSYVIYREQRGEGKNCTHAEGDTQDCTEGMGSCGKKVDETDDKAQSTVRRLLQAQAGTSNPACHETRFFNPTIVENDVLVYDKESYDSFLDVAIDIDGAFFGVKTGFALDYAKSHIETRTGFTYMSTVTANTHRTRIRNAHNLQLRDSAKDLLASGPEGATEFIQRFGSYYVSAFYWGSAFLGSSEYKTSFSDDQETVRQEFGLDYKSMVHSINIDQGLDQRNGQTDVSADIRNNYQIFGSLGQTLTSEDETDFNFVRERKCEWLRTLRQAADTGKVAALNNLTAIMRMDYRNWYDIEAVREIVDQYDDAIVAMFTLPPPSEQFFSWLAKETAHSFQTQTNVIDILRWRCVDQNPEMRETLEDLLADVRDHMDAIESLNAATLQTLWAQFSCRCDQPGRFRCPSTCPKKLSFFVAETGNYDEKIEDVISRWHCDERYMSKVDLVTQAEAKLYSVEQNIDFWKNDLSGQNGLKVASWQHCASLCTRNPSCRAWSWHNGADTAPLLCYLKSSDAGRRSFASKDVQSGQRLSTRTRVADVAINNEVELPELQTSAKRKAAIASGIQVTSGEESPRCSNQGPLVKSLGVFGYAVNGRVPNTPEEHIVRGGNFVPGRTTNISCPGNSFLTGLKIHYNTPTQNGASCNGANLCSSAVPNAFDLRCKTLPAGSYDSPRKETLIKISTKLTHDSSSNFHWKQTTQEQELSCREGYYATAIEIEEAGNCGGSYEDTIGTRNQGKNCWKPCGKQSGPCSWCGSGSCCRKGVFNKQCDAALDMSKNFQHTCVEAAGNFNIDGTATTQGSVIGKITLTCRAATDYLVSDCVKENNLQNGGWSLVRHVPKGDQWHDATDNLLGSQTYGRPCGSKCKTSWSTSWDELDVEEFLLSHGDCSTWLVVNAAQIYANFNNARRTIVNSSNGFGSQSIRMNNRLDVPEDPMIALEDAETVRADGRNVLYLENSAVRFLSGLARDGNNVYIRGNFVDKDDCWTPCGNSGGWCTHCGQGNACCRFQYASDPEECRLAVRASYQGVEDHHRCVMIPDSSRNTGDATTKHFKNVANAAISGHNDKQLQNVTVERCMEACLATEWCKSFDYHKNVNKCDLSKKSADEVGGLTTNIRNNPYDYYERIIEGCQCTDEYNVTRKNGFVQAFCGDWDDDTNWCYLSGGESAKSCPGARKSSGGDFYWTQDEATCRKADASGAQRRLDAVQVQYRVVSQEFGVLSGIDYSLATAIAKRATLTPFSGSSMICRLEPDTATAESVFFTAAPMRARVFKHTQNAAISGHNVRHLSSKTVEDCKSECLKSAWCKSFDYDKHQQACSLSDVNAVAVGGLKTDYVGNPYDYYEMRTLVTAEAVDANNLLERCEQRAAGCWAKVWSGCKGAPASGFGNRWKNIFDFEGKARACGLMAAKIDAQCAVSPGTTEMRYVAAH